MSEDNECEICWSDPCVCASDDVAIDEWRDALSKAVENVVCTDAERDELRDWLAQETPDLPDCEPVGLGAEDEVAEMLAIIRADAEADA